MRSAFEKIIWVVFIIGFATVFCSCANNESWPAPSLICVEDMDIDPPVQLTDSYADIPEIDTVYYIFDPSGSMKGYFAKDCLTEKTVFSSIVPLLKYNTGFIIAKYTKNASGSQGGEGSVELTVSDDCFSVNEMDALGVYMNKYVFNNSTYPYRNTELGDLIKQAAHSYISDVSDPNNSIDKDDLVIVVSDMVFEDAKGETVKTTDVFADLFRCISSDNGIGIGLVKINADYAFGVEHMSQPENRVYYHYNTGEYDAFRTNKDFEYIDGEPIKLYDHGFDSAGHIIHPLYMIVIGKADNVTNYVSRLEKFLSSDIGVSDDEHGFETLTLADDVPELVLANRVGEGDITVTPSDTISKLGGNVGLVSPGYVFYWEAEKNAQAEVIYGGIPSISNNENYPENLEANYNAYGDDQQDIYDFIAKDIPVFPVCREASETIKTDDDCFFTVSIKLTDTATEDILEHWEIKVKSDIAVEEVASSSIDDFDRMESERSGFVASSSAYVDPEDVTIMGDRLMLKCRVRLSELVKDSNKTLIYRVRVSVGFERKDSELADEDAFRIAWLDDCSVDWTKYETRTEGKTPTKGKSQQLDKTPNLRLFNDIVVEGYAKDMDRRLSAITAETEVYFGISFREKTEDGFGSYAYSDEQAATIARLFNVQIEEP